VEARLLPEIAAAERRAQRATVPAVLADTAGPDAAARWAALTLPQRREVIDALMTVRIQPTGRGVRTFRPECVEIIWKGMTP
jgi:site-specific DNA recombinase